MIYRNNSKLAAAVGFDYELVSRVETQLSQNTKQYPAEFYPIGLSDDAIDTSLIDFYEILSSISNKNDHREITICDIGASYCKMAFVAQKFFPNIRVISIEPVIERISNAMSRLGKTKHHFINAKFNPSLISEFKIDFELVSRCCKTSVYFNIKSQVLEFK